MHPILALRVFFYILFGKAIPIEMLPQELLPALPAPAAPPPEKAPEPEPVPFDKRVTLDERPKGPEPETIAVAALSILQSEGRLLDFLSESIDDYADEDIGAAVREVHRGCKKALHDHFKLVPVRAEPEEEMITVPEGYDPAEIRLVGNVVGRPPFSGTLKHRGWRVEEVRLPKVQDGRAGMVVTPAEVEI
jgi:hypothetical protein